MPVRDYCKILDVPYDAPPVAIKVAYRKLAKFYHPDINFRSGVEARMQLVNEAYEILGNPSKKLAYDFIFFGHLAYEERRRQREAQAQATRVQAEERRRQREAQARATRVQAEERRRRKAEGPPSAEATDWKPTPRPFGNGPMQRTIARFVIYTILARYLLIY